MVLRTFELRCYVTLTADDEQQLSEFEDSMLDDFGMLCDSVEVTGVGDLMDESLERDRA